MNEEKTEIRKRYTAYKAGLNRNQKKQAVSFEEFERRYLNRLDSEKLQKSL